MRVRPSSDWLCKLFGAQHLNADQRFLPLDPRIMTWRDRIGRAWPKGLLSSVVHLHSERTRNDVPDVGYLTAVSLHDGLDAFRPLPTRLKIEPPESISGQPNDLDAGLRGRPHLVWIGVIFDFELSYGDGIF